MITGIQITKAANDDLLNSFWLLDSEKNEARCVVAKAGFAEDEIVPVSKLAKLNTVKSQCKCSQKFAWKVVST